MKIFILEDNGERVNRFLNKYVEDAVTIVNNVEQANIILDNIQFDLIFLDHDLGGEMYIKHTDVNTGYQVSKHIKNTENKKATCIIHSFNPNGGLMMRSELHENDIKVAYAPFLSEEFKHLIGMIDESN